MKKHWIAGLVLGACSSMASAADYVIDTEGAHAFVQFKVKHLGYSWLYGRFNTFSGEFSFDKDKPATNKISMQVDVTSLDSNHEKRDLHLRSDDFLDAKKFATASFVSTSYKDLGGDKALVKGDLTLHGVTKPIEVNVEHYGEGSDPWGGYRAGFEGKVVIEPEQWGIPMVKKLGKASAEVELTISVEGIRK